MFKSLKIHGFRGFSNFELSKLGRVNLLVGENNSGKSSILEAVHLLSANGELAVAWQLSTRRGERVVDESSSRNSTSTEVDISHLFLNHDLTPGISFNISSMSENDQVSSIRYDVVSLDESELFDKNNELYSDDFDLFSNIGIKVTAFPESKPSTFVRLQGGYGLSLNQLRSLTRIRSNDNKSIAFRVVRSITTAGLTVDDVVSLFDEVVLTKEEDFVIECMRIIEPDIERIASISTERRRFQSGEKGGILVRSKRHGARLPIGNMGDGIWRLLGLALAIATAKGGILLIDEIDTGLHYTVMDKMWRLINNAAKRLSVQVFATTHSRDCVESLASIARKVPLSESNLIIHRVRKDSNSSVPYSEQEIIALAKHGTEAR